MLEIINEHVQKLNDVDLRSLIGLLCEAELGLEGLSTKYAKWGGAQTAADGGLDVRVDASETKGDGYVPKPITGFQVKKYDLIPSKIKGEMTLNGVLRPSIIELEAQNGAYVIVSGSANATQSKLNKRIAAMDEAVKTYSNKNNLTLDYYDSGRVASWVRNYPGMIIWVRNKIGEALSGWMSYENWANPGGGTDEEYLIDDRMRIRYRNEPICDIETGLNNIREILCVPRASVRLAGLSGVGKTRFAQAIFDNRIGADALDSVI